MNACNINFCNINPCELTLSITALANLIASKFNNDELSVLATIITQLGDTLTTIATQREFCESKETTDTQ